MRKPLLALGLVVTTGFGVLPVANASAATSPSSTLPGSPPLTSPRTTSASPPASSTHAVSGADIVRTAMKYLGYPYTATGNSPQTGFSCIGFVSFVYRQNGISLPGDLQDALNFAPQISFSQLQPGDIMYFQNTVWNGLSHAAIYIGGGKFIHAEWYGKGVRITSFYNDPSDGNYWPAKYLTANRPWTGAAVGSVIPAAPPAVGGTSSTTKPGSVTSSVPTGPASTVTAKSGLYMRTGPSKSSSPIQVLAPGTTVYVIGHSGRWVKIQLADGTIGWVDASYISGSGAAAAATSASSSGDVSVGNATAPARVGKSGTSKKPYVTVQVTGLNIHQSPSASAAVISTAARGQKLTILGYSNGWYKVQLPDGSVGWVTAAYVSAHRSGSSATSGAGTKTAAAGHTAAAALNVRSGPSLNSSVVTVIPVGGSYQILGWSHGWARVQLPNGATGWVSGTVLSGGSSTTTYKSKAGSGVKAAASSYTHRLTAGVRLHTGASIGSRVVAVGAAGTRVAVLGYRNGWALVRLPSGTTGYVLGSYVR